jgi:hypothetical protein
MINLFCAKQSPLYGFFFFSLSLYFSLCSGIVSQTPGMFVAVSSTKLNLRKAFNNFKSLSKQNSGHRKSEAPLFYKQIKSITVLAVCAF